MKILTTLLAVLISIWLLSACGSGDYKLKVEGLGDSETESGDTTDADDPNDEGDDDTGTADHRSDGSELNDTTGGVEWWEEDKKDVPRFFMGTYMFLENSYYNSSYDHICTYGFPLNVRLFSREDSIDLESSTGKLLAIADLYDDETFDFEVGFLNKFGNPSLTLVCTCVVEEGYYSYSKEKIKCGCEPSNDDDNCAVIYEKLD